MRRTQNTCGTRATGRLKHTLLCVDDEVSVLSALRRLLRGEKYDLLTTNLPREALEWVRTRPVSLLMTDQRMPGLSGVELVKAVREASPTTTCVILTAHPDHAVVLERATLHLERLLTKPWEGEHLKRTIRNLLRNHPMRGATNESKQRKDARPDHSLRINCQGMTSGDLLQRLSPESLPVRAGGRRPVIILEHLDQLGDSITTVLKRLAERIVVADFEITLIDGSGYLNAFLDALERLSPESVFQGPIRKEVS
jgi:response regulator RpfG family c-di-GMP phosphodiesterase